MNRHDIPSTDLIDAALRRLGIRKFALAIHDSCFPSTTEEDVGRGSPYGRGGSEFFAFARRLGFNAVQFGPQGKTRRDDPSPYDGAIFSKNILSLSIQSLADDPRSKGLVSAGDLDRLLSLANRHRRETRADRVDYGTAWEVSHGLLDLAYARFRDLRAKQTHVAELAAALDRRVADWRRAPVDWFERDSLYEALSLASGADDWTRWDAPLDQRLYCPDAGEEESSRQRIQEILRQRETVVERFALGQFLLHAQHERMRQETRRLGLRLYGDMHIGCAPQDWWAWRSLFLPGYRLGAPPSRTNPPGQPWGYPVLDPRKICTLGLRGALVPGPALDFIRARVEKMFADFDGVRIDHPQGLVCPWVYRADRADPALAVREGARLYSTPDDPDHPALGPFALVRPEQLNPDPDYPRYGDERVVDLRPEQIERYGVVLDAVVDAAKTSGGTSDDVMCEVLSTWPAPLRAVMTRRGMGRFCVTAKADPRDPDDVYRPEKTTPADWIMVGNHDTKPLWLLAEERKATDWIVDRSRLLAGRLVPASEAPDRFAARIASDPRRFCEAMFAELFLGPARNVSIFFADLFGEKQLYNQPGTVSAENWTLRLPPDYQTTYARKVQAGDALNVPRALAMALEAKTPTLGPEAAALARKLRESVPSPDQPSVGARRGLG